MRRIFFKVSLVSFFSLIVLCNNVIAQTVPAGMPVFDDYYRREQLLGKIDSNLSFSVRPVYPDFIKVHDAFDPDSTLIKNNWVKAGPVSFAKGWGRFQLLPLTVQQQFNSDHPYGWNDGPMIPAKGYQTMISAGFFLKFGPLSIQLRPEYVYAANPEFNGFLAGGRSDTDVESYYFFNNNTDQPERFGNGPYKKLLLGQSSIRLTFNPISIGLSNENIWWGPGVRNALILSNNAPGFKHITINTVRPIKTYVGFFEFQAIAAHLDNTDFTPLSITKLSNGRSVFTPRRQEWRYFTGFNINYHPKWIPGLTLGLTRTFDAYHGDVKTFSDYVPFFFPYQKQNTNDGDPIPRDQYTSLYARWLFTKAQAEVYFEYGLNDNSYNLRDFVGSPEHSRAYILGLRKMISLNAKDQHILFSGEITQLSQTVDRIVRYAGEWYEHSGVTQGHTNMGQVLGAGTGPGGNLQSINVSWVSGLKKLGIEFERYERNADMYQDFFPDINGNSRKWVDFSLAMQGEWNYKNLVFNAKLQQIKSLNYEWVLKDYVPDKYYIPHNTVYNFHAELGITFRF